MVSHRKFLMINGFCKPSTRTHAHTCLIFINWLSLIYYLSGNHFAILVLRVRRAQSENCLGRQWQDAAIIGVLNRYQTGLVILFNVQYIVSSTIAGVTKVYVCDCDQMIFALFLLL